MQEHANTFLENEPIGSLMRKYSIPCIISLLVAALYNIVDQVFIANADYLGSFGNAANTVVFPLTFAASLIMIVLTYRELGAGEAAVPSISRTNVSET